MANCRTGTFQACSSPLGRVLVDKQIYLPERWTQADERGAATRVPKDRGRSRLKSQLALEMLEWALARGLLMVVWVAAGDASVL